MPRNHRPCTQRRHPLLPLKESTHNKALLSPEDKVFVCFRLEHHEASTRQAAWPNLGTSGARNPHFWVISRRPQRGWRKHSMPARYKRTPAPQKSVHQHRPTPGPTHFGAFRRRRCASRSLSARCRRDDIQPQKSARATHAGHGFLGCRRSAHNGENNSFPYSSIAA